MSFLVNIPAVLTPEAFHLKSFGRSSVLHGSLCLQRLRRSRGLHKGSNIPAVLTPEAFHLKSFGRSSVLHGSLCLQRLRRSRGLHKGSNRLRVFAEVSDSEWMKGKTPYDVLGVGAESTEEEIKTAFRTKVKQYHPDVYSGPENADIITQRLIKAYELLLDEEAREEYRRRRQKSDDPFVEPVGLAVGLFVNELRCLGRGCPYSCVARAPKTFAFADDTGYARALTSRGDTEYNINLAVGQCPQNCIHFVTREQQLVLDSLLQSAVEGLASVQDVAVELDGLTARAAFENGRDRTPKRKAKSRDKFVDWF